MQIMVSYVVLAGTVFCTNEHVLSLWTTISTILVKILVTILMVFTLVKLAIFGDSVDET